LFCLFLALTSYVLAVTDPLTFETQLRPEDIQPPVLIEEPFTHKTEALVVVPETKTETETTGTHTHTHIHTIQHGQVEAAPQLKADEEALFRKFEVRRQEEKLKRKLGKALHKDYTHSPSATIQTPVATPIVLDTQLPEISPEEKVLFDKYLAYHRHQKNEHKRVREVEQLARKSKVAEEKRGQCPWAKARQHELAHHHHAAANLQREEETAQVEKSLKSLEQNAVEKRSSCGCPHAAKAKAARAKAEKAKSPKAAKEAKTGKSVKEAKTGKAGKGKKNQKQEKKSGKVSKTEKKGKKNKKGKGKGKKGGKKDKKKDKKKK